MPDETKRARFERIFLPHLDATYNVARWLTRNDDDAQDLVQETYLRAFKFFDGFRGEDGRAWLLRILRNHFYTTLHNRAQQPLVALDEELSDVPCEACDPETILLASADQQRLQEAVAALSLQFREMIVLRELEGFSYKEIAVITSLPLGTVMSRLARARKQLQHDLVEPDLEEVHLEL